jgi:hypothetical protein
MTSKQIFPMSWKPTPLQEDLLKACLLKGAPAEQAFGRWRQEVDIDHLDYESFRLIPLLWKNLSGRVVDPAMAKFKGIYRAAWTRNQLQIGRILPVLDLFSGQGIEFIILKGVCLVDQYYKDPGSRPFDDFDVMVSHTDAEKASHILLNNAWRSMYGGELSDYLRWRHAINMIDDGGYNIDLHWQLAWCMRGPDAPKPFWDDSLPVVFHGLKARTLCPSDLLLHTLIHGARIGAEYGLGCLPIKLIRWIPDAAVVIQDGRVDWEKFCDRAERYFVRLQVGRALGYLGAFHPEAAAPRWVLSRLLKRPSRIIERFHHDATMDPLSARPFFRVQKHYWNHFLTRYWQQRSYEAVDQLHWYQYPGILLERLRSYYKLRSRWLVPFRLCWAFLKRPWRVVFGK